jgi:hypothetical protein
MDNLNKALAFIGKKIDDLKVAIDSRFSSETDSQQKLESINRTLLDLTKVVQSIKLDIPETKLEIPEETRLESGQFNSLVDAIEATVTTPMEFPACQTWLIQIFY